MKRLRVENLSRRFAPDHPPAVDGVSFHVEANEIFTLVGPSGCGKTTTLRIIAGFEHPDAGSVFLNDAMIEGPGVHRPPEKRRIGLVFQEYAIFPHLDVGRNVMFGLTALSRADRQRRVSECLEMVGMSGYERRRVHELSGGQQQRVALARSLAPRPDILLLDEPFSNLDPSLRHETRQQIKKLLRDHAISALLVTHDQEEALSFSDRLAVMMNGRIGQIGKPLDVYTRPNCRFVAQFLGKTNLLQVAADGQHAATPIGQLCLNQPMVGTTWVSVRPEHLKLSVPKPHLPVGTVVGRDFKGHDLTLQVKIDTQSYTVQADYDCPFYIGDRVGLTPTELAVVIHQ